MKYLEIYRFYLLKLLYELFSSLPDYLTVESPTRYQEIFTSLSELYGSAVKADEIMMHSLILELAYLLERDAKKQLRRNSSAVGSYEVINRAIAYIKENLTNDLSLEAVSAHSNLSPIHFHNRFKSATGKTLHQFVEEQRIKKASELLVTTDWTLTRISGECGFSSQSYFSYAFKRKLGMTPREYAKKVYKRYCS